MSLQTDGYLSPEISEWITKNRAEHDSWFALADRLNRVAQRLILVAVVPDNDSRSLFVLLFFARAVSSFQGALLLAERGMTSEAQTLARSCLETSFYIGAVANDVVFLEHLIRSDTAHKKKVAKWLTTRDASATELSSDQIWKLKGFLENVKSPVRSIEIKQAAKQAHLEDIYETLYRYLCDHGAHPSLNSLSRYVVLDADGRVVGLRFGPDADDIKDTLLAMTTALFRAISVVIKVFPRDELDLEIGACWEVHEQLLSREIVELRMTRQGG